MCGWCKTSGPARFTAAGCPVEDAAFCDQAARAANALVARDADALVAVSRPEPSRARSSTARSFRTARGARTYHLAFTAALAGEKGEPAERWLGSLELVMREGEWVSSVVFVDSVRAWRTEYADPFGQLACGNVRPWASG